MSFTTSPLGNNYEQDECFQSSDEDSHPNSYNIQLDQALKKVTKLETQLNTARKQALKLKYERDFLLDKISVLQKDEEERDNSSQPSDNTMLAPIQNLVINTNLVKSIDNNSKGDQASKKRARKSASSIRRVQPVPRGIDGQPILPVQIGILTVLSLGEIVYDRKTFHNERYLWPVGYTVQRSYQSTVHSDKSTIYKCSIIDGGTIPKFYIEAQDRNEPIIANTATGVWTTIIKLSNKIRKREHSNSASGPDYYGFSNPTIAMLIQNLPNARKCENYVWQEFELMSKQSSKKAVHNNKPASPINLSRNNSTENNKMSINKNLLTHQPSSDDNYHQTQIQLNNNDENNEKVKIDDEYDLDDALNSDSSSESE